MCEGQCRGCLETTRVAVFDRATETELLTDAVTDERVCQTDDVAQFAGCVVVTVDETETCL